MPRSMPFAPYIRIYWHSEDDYIIYLFIIIILFLGFNDTFLLIL